MAGCGLSGLRVPGVLSSLPYQQPTNTGLCILKGLGAGRDWATLPGNELCMPPQALLAPTPS